jgi:hypothetical protein
MKMKRNDLTPETDITRMDDWDTVDTFVARCYGTQGDKPGDVPVSVAMHGIDDTDETVWVAAETPDECTNIIGIYDTREEAVTAALAHAKTEDES